MPSSGSYKIDYELEIRNEIGIIHNTKMGFLWLGHLVTNVQT
jgi:hypothetical protein